MEGSLLDRLAGREGRTGRRCLNIGRSELDYLLQERLRPLLCPLGMCLFPPRVDVLLHLDVEQEQTDYQYGHYDRHRVGEEGRHSALIAYGTDTTRDWERCASSLFFPF